MDVDFFTDHCADIKHVQNGRRKMAGRDNDAGSESLPGQSC